MYAVMELEEKKICIQDFLKVTVEQDYYSWDINTGMQLYRPIYNIYNFGSVGLFLETCAGKVIIHPLNPDCSLRSVPPPTTSE